MTPARRNLFGTGLLLAALLAGCGTPPPEESPLRTAAAGSTTPTPAPTPDSTPLPTSSPRTPDAGLRPPLIVPAVVAAREELPWCGHEVVPLASRAFDAQARTCFLEAYENGEPAELVMDGFSIEGGRVRSIYRSLEGGGLEVYYDSTDDAYSMREWTLTQCATLTLMEFIEPGVPAFFQEDCAPPRAIVADPPETQPTADELSMIHNLVTFAQSRDPYAFAEISWTEEVALGLADEILVSRSPDALELPSSWALEREFFRDHTGPFSALDLLGRWDQNAARMLVRELSMVAGPHPRCASAPAPAPAELADLRRVSVQPVGPDTCLLWWTVDFFLTDDGRVAAVTLDLHEP